MHKLSVCVKSQEIRCSSFLCHHPSIPQRIPFCLYILLHILAFWHWKLSLTLLLLAFSPETKKPGQFGARWVNAHSFSWLAVGAALLERGNQATSTGAAERKNRVKGKRSAKIPSVLVCDRKDVVQVCGCQSPAWESGLLLFYRRQRLDTEWLRVDFYHEKYGIWTHQFKGKRVCLKDVVRDDIWKEKRRRCCSN